MTEEQQAERREKKSIYNREYRRSHKEETQLQQKEYYLLHREKLISHSHEYYNCNKKARVAHVVAYRKKRYASDPQFRLSHQASKAIRGCLKSNSGSKNGQSWLSLVGYTVAELKAHLESQFLPGMSWENRGEWHVDHIRPICSFNFTSPEDIEFKQCWELSNLRPLWKADNLKKAAEDRKLSVRIKS